MSNAPIKLSIVIPAHNEEKYLPATLESLQSAVRELQVSAEIIVANDASTDQTEALANAAGCQVVTVNLRNIGAVRNAGARVAKGDWLLFVDADTHVPVETLRQTIQLMESGFVGGGALVQPDQVKSFSLVKRLMCHAVVLVWQTWGGWAAGCYMFCSQAAFRQFGGFDESYYAAEEFFFSRNLKRMGKFKLVTVPVVTSTRKLNSYSTWQLIRFLFVPMLSGRWLRSKRGLEVLYEGKR